MRRRCRISPARSMSDGDRVPNRDGIVPHSDLFDRKLHDATILCDVERLGIFFQTFPERGQDLGQPERAGLVHRHGVQVLDFALDGLVSNLQCRHAAAQLLERHQPLLIGGQKAFHAVSEPGLFLLQGLKTPLARVRLVRRLPSPLQLVFDQGRVVQETENLLPDDRVERVLPEGFLVAKRRSSVAIGVRSIAPVVVDRPGARSSRGAVEPIAAMLAVEQALQKTLDLCSAQGELLVLPEPLFGQGVSFGRHDCRDRDLDPLFPGPIDGSRTLRHPASLEPYGTRDPLSRSALRFSEAGRSPVGRILEDPPDGAPLPAASGLAGRDPFFVQSGRDRTDGQAIHRVERIDLAHHGRLRLMDFVGTGTFLGLRNVPEPVGRSAQDAGLPLLGPMALAPTGSFQDLRPFVFGDHSLELKQETILGSFRLGRPHEDRFDPVPGEFLQILTYPKSRNHEIYSKSSSPFSWIKAFSPRALSSQLIQGRFDGSGILPSR